MAALSYDEPGYGLGDYGEVPEEGRVTRPHPVVGPAPARPAGGQRRPPAPARSQRDVRQRGVAHRRAVVRRNRAAAALVSAAAVVAVVVVATSGGGTGRNAGRYVAGTASSGGRAAGGSTAPGRSTGAAGRHAAAGGARPPAGAGTGAGIPAAEAGTLPWQLPVPISREALMPGPGGQLLLAGGLTSAGSQTGVFDLNVTTGVLGTVGNLPAATHDAASAALGGGYFVFGGGSAAPAGYVQEVTASGATQALAPLPQLRSDAEAVVMAGTAYVVGGYSGTAMDPAVLATSDGVHLRSVANLAVPVRYPALAALGGRIYVFGGSTLSGTPVSTVQVVDPANGSSRVIGQLPEPLAGASAAVMDGHIYLAGGQTATAGGVAGPESGSVYAYDPAQGRFLLAGSLRAPVAYAGTAVMGGRMWMVGGEVANGTATTYAQVVSPNKGFGYAGLPGAGVPYYGDKLLIADRGNNRLLVVSDTGRILWHYPNRNAPPPPGGFYFPDDAFFIHHGTAIISNQEENETLVEIGYPSGKVLWQYGHPHQPGYAPGYLNNPDDAYLLKNGEVVVADPKNCRVLFIDPATKQVIKQIGTSTVCYHNPPNYLGSPNGDTPLADGNILVSEINGGWIDEYTPQGKLVWTTHVPITYPSDPQHIGRDLYLVANYQVPGSFLFFNRAGQVLYQYGPTSGPGALNQPSLAVLVPSSGVVMLNDDYNDRIVAIDPRTSALVWQYGQTGVAGTAPGLLNTPDGFDILGPGGTFPTHPVTG